MVEVNIRQQVEEIVAEIRPTIQSHGGEIEMVDLVDGILRVRLSGTCDACSFSSMTLAFGLERVLLQRVPEIKGVVNVAEAAVVGSTAKGGAS